MDTKYTTFSSGEIGWHSPGYPSSMRTLQRIVKTASQPNIRGVAFQWNDEILCLTKQGLSFSRYNVCL